MTAPKTSRAASKAKTKAKTNVKTSTKASSKATAVASRGWRGLWAGFWQLVALALITGLSLQIVFFVSIASLRWWQPPSTSCQRSAIWEQLGQAQPQSWLHEVVAGERISDQARKAVIASEDNFFFTHRGADWEAMQRAWGHNARQGETSANIRGGSTITQQLAKNLFLSGERSLPRKGQELLLAWMLEAALDKHRILDIYLNQVEWGVALYGIEAAAQHYFRTSAAQLGAQQAAQLATLLPQPRRLGPLMHQSRYVQGRTRIIVRRMGAVQLPAKGNQ